MDHLALALTTPIQQIERNGPRSSVSARSARSAPSINPPRFAPAPPFRTASSGPHQVAVRRRCVKSTSPGMRCFNNDAEIMGSGRESWKILIRRRRWLNNPRFCAGRDTRRHDRHEPGARQKSGACAASVAPARFGCCDGIQHAQRIPFLSVPRPAPQS